MSPKDSPVAGPSGVPSHTSTNQWQSFEMRMRLRRAERCVLRAEVALEAGFPDDARAALEEAQRLDSSAPDFDSLNAMIARWPPPEPAPRRARRIAVAAAIVSIALAAGGAAYMMGGKVEPGDSMAAGIAIPSPRSNPPRRDVSLAVTRPSGTRPVASIATEFVRPEIERAATRDVREPARVEGTKTVAARPTPDAEPREPEAPPAEPAPSLPQPAASPLAVGTVATLPVLRADAPVTIPEAVAPGDEQPRVRAVLARYEAAYSSLNVDGVRSVWPGVDARSLSRAFDGLESQRVSLGQCSMTIGASTARAECSGTATWTPRIGGGTRRENRAWQFELRNAAGAWQIARVTAR